VDILDRVLDKGLVIAGDINVSLANVELLTIRIRLLVCSIDKAEQIGLNWLRYDRFLVASESTPEETTIARLEQRIAEVIALVDLSQLIDRRFHTFSSGMRPPPSLARPLLGDPDIILFDEASRPVRPVHAH